ncbi:hypothetical protein Q9L58_006761 [Maublancomyces gigas]|uniref:Uncharacterized protein n=1 Tax=Discina gigas TaxID=1032678 RepID=A0ABR3GEF5_9PEZI
MNNIPRGTPRAKLMNSLLAPHHRQGTDTGPGSSAKLQPDVIFGCIMAESRLDDELSVASIDFSITPKWLQDLNRDPHGFPKETTFGTLWRGVDTRAIDEDGRTEFIRAVIKGSTNLHYAEMLAEFEDTDVNVQDKQRRTALHWASAENVSVMVELCLSVPECEIGLKDNDSLTAFDISLRVSSGSEAVPALFYKSMFEMQETHPQAALLRVLTVTSEPDQDKRVFPGTAIFAPLQDGNIALVNALIDRGIDHTARDQDGDTALHVAAKFGNVEIVTRLLEKGSDVNAIGNGGATPLHYAVEKNVVQTLLVWEAKPDVRNIAGMTPLDLAKDPMIRQELRAAEEKEEAKEKEAKEKEEEREKEAVPARALDSHTPDGADGPKPPTPDIGMTSTESQKFLAEKEPISRADVYEACNDRTSEPKSPTRPPSFRHHFIQTSDYMYRREGLATQNIDLAFQKADIEKAFASSNRRRRAAIKELESQKVILVEKDSEIKELKNKLESISKEQSELIGELANAREEVQKLRQQVSAGEDNSTG